MPNSNFRPNKRLGQHWLIDQQVLAQIIQAANLNAKDVILEIGPGQGILTQALIQQVHQVVAVEKDKRLAEQLQKLFKNQTKVKIIQGDILKVKLPDLKNYKIVANLPYYITSPVIRLFLEAKHQPQSLTLMVQKEVGQRICRQAPKMNLLAVSIQFYAQPKIINWVSKKSFWPQPQVDSALIQILPKPKPTINIENFFQLVKAGFKQPRKQLINNLTKAGFLDKETLIKKITSLGLSTKCRPANLSLDQWILLTQDLS